MALLGYPDGQSRHFPNQFAQNNGPVTGTGEGSTMPTTLGMVFGFNAAIVKIAVDAGTVYLRLDSTAGATTKDYQQTTGDLLQNYQNIGAGIAGVSFAATSTAALVRVGAWG